MAAHIPFKVYNVRTWTKAKALFSNFSLRWIFRGQSDDKWRLTTSLERILTPTNTTTPDEFENIIYWEFRRRAHHYLPSNLIPGENDKLGWLALMQHHGAPTRLLDWTRSPYVAAYFALEEAADHCAVWGIDCFWLQKSAVRKLKTLGKGYSALSDFGLLNRTYVKGVTTENCPGVFPVEPLQLNQRLTIQRGLFLYPGSLEQGFEGNLLTLGHEEDELKQHIVQIRLPKTIRTDALDDLYQMNIGRSSLFPGLDGFAQSLKYNALVLTDEAYLHRNMDRNLK